MTSGIFAKKKKFRPLKLLRKLRGGGNKASLESLPTLETAPSDTYYVPPSPEYFQREEQRERKPNLHSEEVTDCDSEDKIDLAYATNDGSNERFDGVEDGEHFVFLDITVDESEQQIEDVVIPDTEADQGPDESHPSPPRRVLTRAITPSPEGAVEIGIIVDTIFETELNSEPAHESAATTVNVVDTFLYSCVGPMSVDPPGKTVEELKVIIPASIERVLTSDNDKRMESVSTAVCFADQSPFKDQSLTPTMRGDTLNSPTDIHVPITMQRSMTLPGFAGSGSVERSAYFGVNSKHKYPRKEESIEPSPNTPSLIVGDLEHHEEIIQAVRRSDLSLILDDSSQMRYQMPIETPLEFKPKKFSENIQVVSPSGPTLNNAAQVFVVQELNYVPPQRERVFATTTSSLKPRRTVAAVPRTAPLTAANLCAVSRGGYGKGDSYDDDEDTTFDLADDESGTSYLPASESGYTTEETGSMFITASDFTEASNGSVFSADMTDTGTEIFLTEYETDNDDQTEYLTEDEDDEKSIWLGGELIEMANELQKGGSQVFMSWLDLR